MTRSETKIQGKTLLKAFRAKLKTLNESDPESVLKLAHHHLLLVNIEHNLWLSQFHNFKREMEENWDAGKAKTVIERMRQFAKNDDYLFDKYEDEDEASDV